MTKYQGCGSGLIQSASSFLAQSGFGSVSGSTKSLNPDSMRFWIHNRTLEVFKFNFKLKSLIVCTISYLLVIQIANKITKKLSFSSFYLDPDPGSGFRIQIHIIIESRSTTLLDMVNFSELNLFHA
jgi:hypothetical protein